MNSTHPRSATLLVSILSLAGASCSGPPVTESPNAIVQIASANSRRQFVCARTRTGAVHCRDLSAQWFFTPVTEGAVDVSVGDEPLSVCVRTADGTARCWVDRSQDFQLQSWEAIPWSQTDITEIEGGFYGCVRIGTDHWECGTPGPVASKRTYPGEVELRISGGHESVLYPNGMFQYHALAPLTADVRLFGAGRIRVCAVRGDGRLTCGETAFDAAGIAPPGLTELHLGYDFQCGLLDDRTVRCWGENAIQQLGDGTTIAHDVADPVTPTGVGVVDQLLSVSSWQVGLQAMCALRDGAVRCWGQWRETATGDLVRHPAPVPVSFEEMQ